MLDLVSEDREDGASASEHVAEADRHEGTPGGLRLSGRERLGLELGAAQHAGGVGCLVGAHVDVVVDVDRLGRVEQVAAALDVGLAAFLRMVLEQREVLERRGVEDHVGTMLLEDLEDSIAITDVGDHEVARFEQCPTLDRQLQPMEGRLVSVEHDQLLGVERGQLAAELGSDRTTGTGHEDPLATDVFTDRCDVDFDFGPAQKVGLGQFTNVAGGQPTDQLGGRRQNSDIEAFGLRQLVEFGDERRIGRRNGDEQHVGVGRSGDRPQVLAGAVDLHTVDLAAGLDLVVVEQADGDEPRVAVTHHGTDDLLAAFAGAEHQHPALAAIEDRTANPILRDTPDESQAQHDHEDHRQRQHQGQGRHRSGEQEVVGADDDRRRDPPHLDDVQGLVDTSDTEVTDRKASPHRADDLHDRGRGRQCDQRSPMDVALFDRVARRRCHAEGKEPGK